MQDPAQVHAFQVGTKDYSIKSFLEFYKTHVGLTTGKVIDLGSGTGEYLIPLSYLYPKLEIIGYDGSEEMIKLARGNVETATSHVQIRHAEFKDITDTADCVVSTNTLHHMHDPKIFWDTARRISKQCLVMDLVRPESVEQAELIVQQYAEHEPQIFKDDFLNSLLAAFSVEEITQQIKDTNLTLQVINGRFNTLQSFLIVGTF
jgi:SAM-dependent methyltransferase